MIKSVVSVALLVAVMLTFCACSNEKLMVMDEFSRVVFNEISELISDDYVEEQKSVFAAEIECFEECLLPDEISRRDRDIPTPKTCSSTPSLQSSVENKTLQEYMKAMDKSFAYKLFDYIDSKGMTDVECYKKANVDKKTFSKIKCNPDTYKPSKQTAVAFAIALELTLDETQDLLASAGLTLSRSFTFDKIINYHEVLV